MAFDSAALHETGWFLAAKSLHRVDQLLLLNEGRDMAKAADYFVRSGNDERGPTTAARIRQLAAAGKLSQDDLIQRGENGNWFRAGDLPGLIDNVEGSNDGELIEDPMVNLAKKSAGALTKVVGSVGNAAGQMGGAIKGVMARRPEEKSHPPAFRSPVKSPTPTVRIPAAEAELLTRTPIAGPLAVGDTTLCPFCSETIKKAAKKCKHCGEILDVVLRQSQHSSAPPAPAPVINITNVNTANANNGDRRGPAWSPFVAALLSFLIPGLGQLYKGQILNGIVWFFVVLIGYAALVVPGVVLHVCCILGAAMGDPYR